MASLPFTVSYTQDNDANNGSITFNGKTKPASGRLDKVGDFVFADGFSAQGVDVMVECVRTSKKTMQIRILFVVPSDALNLGYCYDACTGVEKILNKVPITFDH